MQQFMLAQRQRAKQTCSIRLKQSFNHLLFGEIHQHGILISGKVVGLFLLVLRCKSPSQGNVFLVNQNANVRVALDYEKLPKGWFSCEKSSVFGPVGRSCTLPFSMSNTFEPRCKFTMEFTTYARFTTQLFLRILSRSNSLQSKMHNKIYYIQRTFFAKIWILMLLDLVASLTVILS